MTKFRNSKDRNPHFEKASKKEAKREERDSQRKMRTAKLTSPTAQP